MTELRFEGRSAIVTGAGRGVGRCHALMLASRGAKVVVADLGGELDGSGSSSGPADEVVSEIEAAGGEAVACHASVAEEAGAMAIVETAMEAFGRVDVVVNNAGIADPDWFEDLTMERFRRMVEVHFLGTTYVCFAAWKHMIEAGYGRIVNTCSEAAFGLVPKATSYGASKGGILSLTRELALEGPRHGIRVNAVAPRAKTRLSGPPIMAKTYDVDPGIFDGVMDQFKPELVSPAAVFLAHETCELDGEVLISGGGQVMRVALTVNEGIVADDISPEFIAENVDTLMDASNATEMVVEANVSDETRSAIEASSAD